MNDNLAQDQFVTDRAVSVQDDAEPLTNDDAESKDDTAFDASDDDDLDYDVDEKEESSNDPCRIVRENLSIGFRSLKETRNIKKDHSEAFNRPPHFYPSVNFFDPTSAGTLFDSKNSPQKYSFLTSIGSKAGSGDSSVSLNLFEKLTACFTRDYGSTLRSVPYEHPRTGAPGIIERLPIRAVLTQSYGTSPVLVGDVSSSSTASTGITGGPVSDPAEWHSGPYCHVYIAVCENLEHYRSKVRPSLQAFVSQIESAATNRISHSSKAMAPSMNYSSHYVIVYVPIGSDDSDDTSVKTSATESLIVGGNRLLGNALGSRLNAARKQMILNREANDSTHSGESSGTELANEFTNEAEAPPPGPVKNSSKLQKEILKKFAADFPNGRTCILSTLLGATSDDSVATMSPLKNQEWNGFLRMLGSAVVSGFRDRYCRYEEEFRRLEALRAAGNRTISKLGKGSKSSFDIGYFFLVKESLAFVYEQMQMPAEALVVYEELRELLPESSGDAESVTETDEERTKRLKKASKLQRSVSDSTAIALAIAGDSIDFRARLRTVTDLGIIEQVVLQYLYARETQLLFQINSPVEILRRSHAFVRTMYKLKMKGIGLIKDKKQLPQDPQKRTLDAEHWALRFCWDVKCATDNFFTVLQINENLEIKEFSFSKMDSLSNFPDEDEESVPADPAVENLEKRLALKVGELLEFARLRFLRIGNAEGSFENPITKYTGRIPSDMLKPWEPWVALESDVAAKSDSSSDSPSRQILEANGDDLLEGAFLSEIAFENRYLQIAEAVARCNRLAGRRRVAARFQTEISEIYARRGDYKAAVQSILPILDVCANDGWARCYFWHLFRLASSQRSRCKVASYLNTLSLCFGPHLTEVAPRPAAVALQKDFEAVVSHPQVGTLRLGVSSFLESDLEVQPTSGGVSSMLLNFVRKKLMKSYCKVGEEVKVTLTLRSHLANPIIADAIQILLVAFGKYEELFHSHEMVSSNDAFFIMSVEGSTEVKPGENIYHCVWTPMSTGIFALSTVQMQWKQGCFHYDSAVLRKPLSAIEVIPSDPTQTLELNPLFLIPGQIQQVRVTFNAGFDIIKEGVVELVCSDGLQVISPGTELTDDKWVETCSMALPPCNADGIVTITTFVKSQLSKSLEHKLGLALVDSLVTAGSVQTIQARVTTSYFHAGYGRASLAVQEANPSMKCTLEAMVTTLDKPAFTVDRCHAYSYAEDKVLITVSLHCNTPVPFSAKEWEVELPRLKVEPDGDLNQELFDHPISEGEQLSLAFNCSYAKGQTATDDSLPVLRIVLQDEYGKTFNQVMPLDLHFFYEKMRRDEEYTGANSLEVSLSCSALEGLVGAPVTFSLQIDATKVARPKRVDGNGIILLYRIISDETDWIVGGRVKGLLECSKTRIFNVDFVGIPVRPGVLKQFPTLLVQYKSDQEDAPLMTVHLHHPDYFKSLSFVNHMALACPAGLES